MSAFISIEEIRAMQRAGTLEAPAAPEHSPRQKKKPTPPRCPKPEGLLKWEAEQREKRKAEQAAANDNDAAADDETVDSDVRISLMLADRMAGTFLYEHGGKGWRVYLDGRWEACATGEETEIAKVIGPAILKEALGSTASDPDAAGRMIRLAKRAMSAAGVSAALQLARSDRRLAARPADFDQDPDLLNVANGVIHLPSGELRPHSPDMRMVRQSPVEYKPDAQAPQWLRFLDEISCHDADWIDYLRRALAYTLSGRVNEEMLFFMLGRGANGKSVLVNVLRAVLGPFVGSVPTSFLATSKNDDKEGASPVKASLQGLRMALANEVEAGSKLSSQTVKEVTSTEAIAARHLYKDLFNFTPTHKLWVRGNHKPIITDNDEGIWRRIALIPFERNFSPDEQDKRLEERLLSEREGILAWLVAGYAEYQRHGLRPARRVAAASAAYRVESDLIGQWLDEEALIDPSMTCAKDEAYASYIEWCGRQGVGAMSKTSLTRALDERGIAASKTTSAPRIPIYKGFCITSQHRPF
ncbi:DNA primase family protein [Ralstonia pseudosolanacearum]|uniref:DNA primase family protein n=1 Tax=Ralstonia pseudosolanacearum TaxID=1310165 RepID=UPI003AAF39C1